MENEDNRDEDQVDSEKAENIRMTGAMGFSVDPRWAAQQQTWI